MKISKICCDGSEKSQKDLYSVIPSVTEESLSHDESGYTYNSGSFMVMEAMMWKKTLVSTRRLHKVPPPGAVVDLLVRESIFMSRLRHPNILLLVGMCRTSSPSSVVLLYERVYWGSLYQFLYQKYEKMAVWEMCALMRQICSAVSYLHDHDLLHTTINSHSIHVVSQSLAKLGNFEYMVENNKRQGLQTRSMLVPTAQTSYLYHWTAPEILAENPVSEMSDLYSLCAVIWEILHGLIPWVGLNVEEIKCKMLMQRKRLPIEDDYLEPPFNVILQQGLSMYPSCRKITVPDLQDILTNIISNREQINLSQQSVSPKKRTKMSLSEPKRKNQRKSLSDQSLRVSFDETDAPQYEPSIKSSTPARRAQSARPAKADSPDVPPRRNSKRSPRPAAPNPEDVVQVSISSIEGSQSKSHNTSGIAFARSLSNGSRVTRRSMPHTHDVGTALASGYESTISPAAAHFNHSAPENVDEVDSAVAPPDSSAVRRSLFQAPRPYKPSNNNLSSLTKVSFNPNPIRDPLLNSSETSSLSQMPQMTSSSNGGLSFSNGHSFSNHVSSPADSPAIINRHISAFSRPLQSRNVSFTEKDRFLEKDGYVRTPTGWMLSGLSPYGRPEKIETPIRKTDVISCQSGKKSSPTSVDQGIQTELNDNCPEGHSSSGEKRSWQELPCVKKRIDSFQEIADERRAREEKIDSFFNKSNQEKLTTSTPQVTYLRNASQEITFNSPSSMQKKTASRLNLNLSPKLGSGKPARNKNEEFDLDRYLKEKDARNERIHQLREKYKRSEPEYATDEMEMVRLGSSVRDRNNTNKSNVQTFQTAATPQGNRLTDTPQEKRQFAREQESEPEIVEEKIEEIRIKKRLSEFGGQEDSYFDDVLDPTIKRERHMRLQTTLGLDQSSVLLDSMMYDPGSPAAVDDTTFVTENNLDVEGACDLTLEELTNQNEEDADVEDIDMGEADAIEGAEAAEVNLSLEAAADLSLKGEAIHQRKNDHFDEEPESKKDVQNRAPLVGEGDTMEKVDDRLLNHNNNNSSADFFYHDQQELQFQDDEDFGLMGGSNESRYESTLSHGPALSFVDESCDRNFQFNGLDISRDAVDIVEVHQQDTDHGLFDEVDADLRSTNNNASMGFREKLMFREVIDELEELERISYANQERMEEIDGSESVLKKEEFETVQDYVETCELPRKEMVVDAGPNNEKGLTEVKEEDCSELFYMFQVKRAKHKPISYQLKMHKSSNGRCDVHFMKKDRTTGVRKTLFKDAKNAGNLRGKLILPASQRHSYD